MTAATSASVSGMCGATAQTRSCRSNAASVPTSVQLVHARTKSTVLGRPWAFPGPTTGKRSRQANGRMFRQHCRSACHILIDRHLRVSVRYFRQMRETRRHRSSCYGPREDEEEEVGEATLFLRTRVPAKTLEHRTKPSHFLQLAVVSKFLRRKSS